jgi:sortase A
MPLPALRAVERLALWLGAIVLTYAAGTMAWAGARQRQLSRDFDYVVAATGEAGEAGEAGAPVARPAGLRDGDVIGRLDIPSVGISVMVLQGVEREALGVGAGHVPGTPLPGARGNVAIAAHRDTYFRPLEGIRPRDAIQVSTVGGTYDYAVESTEVVDPQDTRVIESQVRSELTLITCYPFQFVGAAPRRFIVHARPVVQPPPARPPSPPDFP